MSTTSASTTTGRPKSTNNNAVRIVSYNLLSSKLARSSHFTHSQPEHLAFEYRLPLILEKLDDAMKRDFDGDVDGDGATTAEKTPPTIFALQEVCYPFASELHTFFAQRGYHFVTGLYGRPFNGYMGVGIAYPLKDFETVKVDICRLSDERSGGWPREKKVDEEKSSSYASGLGLGGIMQKITKTVEVVAARTIQTVINNHFVKRLGYSPADEKKIDPWEMSEKRFNVLLTVVLRFAGGTGGTFAFSNYHMPCAFFAPPVMNIHSEMVSRRVQDLAAASWNDSRGGDGSDDDAAAAAAAAGGALAKTVPYILAGDFNILPDSPQYKLLTTGELDESDPTYPPPKHGVDWKVECQPMDSAYARKDANGAEPEFTNYAHCRDDPDPFIGTLDYIFLSRKEIATGESKGSEISEWWKVHGVRKLSCKADSGGPFPNQEEPSDHYLISADLELVPTET